VFHLGAKGTSGATAPEGPTPVSRRRNHSSLIELFHRCACSMQLVIVIVSI
jgi:hypothetical protein